MKYILSLFAIFFITNSYAGTIQFSCYEYPIGSTFTLRMKEGNKYVSSLGKASSRFCRESVSNLNVRELELPDDNSKLLDIYSCELHPIGATFSKIVINHKGEVVDSELIKRGVGQSYCLESMVEKNLITSPRRNPDFVAEAEPDLTQLLSELARLQQRVSELEGALASCRD
ncbi:MAG: hypothetical protein CME71_01960 [Halobacteriovorax sp.]|nr:hypothetical protein [Halobacteriovorax sp.]